MAKVKQATKKKAAPRKKKGDAAPNPTPENQEAVGTSAPPDQAPGPGHNGHSENTDDDVRVLFVDHHVPKYEEAKRGIEAAAANMRDVKAKAKADGFTVKQLEDAFLLQTPEGEAKIRKRIMATVAAARWMGASIGTQFALFGEPDRTPAVDRAFDEGKLAGMRGEVRKPPYDPSVPQYGRWIDGWHVGQEALMRKPGGIGNKANGATAAADAQPESQADQQPADQQPGAEDEPDLRPPHLRMRDADRAAEAAVRNATAPGHDGADEFPEETM